MSIQSEINRIKNEVAEQKLLIGEIEKILETAGELSGNKIYNNIHIVRER